MSSEKVNDATTIEVGGNTIALTTIQADYHSDTIGFVEEEIMVAFQPHKIFQSNEKVLYRFQVSTEDDPEGVPWSDVKARNGKYENALYNQVSPYLQTDGFIPPPTACRWRLVLRVVSLNSPAGITFYPLAIPPHDCGNNCNQ